MEMKETMMWAIYLKVVEKLELRYFLIMWIESTTPGQPNL